ncbi:24-methylenesterol C-methyltransferase 2-like protein [Tanacetum coccineum]
MLFVVLEKHGIVAKGTVDVQEMLLQTVLDLAKGGETGIFSPMHMIGRFDICRRHMLFVVLEKHGIVAKGTVDVQEMLLQPVLDLAKGGETGIFSPMQ